MTETEAATLADHIVQSGALRPDEWALVLPDSASKQGADDPHIVLIYRIAGRECPPVAVIKEPGEWEEFAAKRQARTL